jgi:hypothetical protein
MHKRIATYGIKKGPKVQLAGQTFGKLLVIKQEGSNPYGTLWQCQCECGRKVTTLGTRLRQGVTKSCGCMQLRYRFTKSV